MIINRAPKPKTGICFAWTPKWTEQGSVWLEWVHWRYNDTEFGSYTYRRWIPQDRYDAGERVNSDG